MNIIFFKKNNFQPDFMEKHTCNCSVMMHLMKLPTLIILLQLGVCSCYRMVNSYSDRLLTSASNGINRAGQNQRALRDFSGRDLKGSRYNSRDDIKFRHEPDIERTHLDDRQQFRSNDIVRQYTSSFLSSLTVAFSSAISMFLMMAIASKMIVGAVYTRSIALVAVILSGMVFVGGHLGDFARASGVLLILLTNQMDSIGEFALKLMQLSRSAVGISARRPYPPALDPWRYVASETDRRSEIGFRMRNALVGLALIGLFFGYTLSTYIPLLPNSIGALVLAVWFSYIGTYRDGLGDLFRFVGSTSVSIVSNTISAANQVGLTVKLSVLFSQFMSAYSLIDQQFGLTSGVYMIFEKLYGVIFVIIKSFQRGQPDLQFPYREERVRYQHMHGSGSDLADDDQLRMPRDEPRL